MARGAQFTNQGLRHGGRSLEINAKTLTEDERILLREVKLAFADVPYPGDDRITKMHFTVSGLPCQECEAVRRAFAARKWPDYFEDPYQLLGYFPPRRPTSIIGRDFMPLLRVSAFHYYLPLLLAAMMIDPAEADVMWDGLPGQFDPGRRPDPAVKPEDADSWETKYAYCADLMFAMSPAQRAATAAVIRHLHEGERAAGGEWPSPEDAARNLDAGKVIAWMRHHESR